MVFYFLFTIRCKIEGVSCKIESQSLDFRTSSATLRLNFSCHMARFQRPLPIVTSVTILENRSI
jgi:hypothetical protein